MANFETGVSGYVEATATVRVFFPIDLRGNAEICCRMCYYFRTGSSSCALNGEICEYPSKYVGGSCPLQPAKEGETSDVENDLRDGRIRQRQNDRHADA